MVVTAGVYGWEIWGCLRSILHCKNSSHIHLEKRRAGTLRPHHTGTDKRAWIMGAGNIMDPEKHSQFGKAANVQDLNGYQVSFIRRKYIQSSFSQAAYVGIVHCILQVWRYA